MSNKIIIILIINTAKQLPGLVVGVVLKDEVAAGFWFSNPVKVEAPNAGGLLEVVLLENIEDETAWFIIPLLWVILGAGLEVKVRPADCVWAPDEPKPKDGGLEETAVCVLKLNPVVLAAVLVVPPKLKAPGGFAVVDKLVPNAGRAVVVAAVVPLLDPNPKPGAWEEDVAVLVPNPKLLVVLVVAAPPKPNPDFVVAGVVNPKFGLGTWPVDDPKLNPEVWLGCWEDDIVALPNENPPVGAAKKNILTL